MKIVLLGSPDISVDAFKEVIANFDVVAIVTQPDRKQGRGMVLKETAVAKLGNDNNIKVFKPNKISEIKDELEALNMDVMLTFAFGQYLPKSILDLPKLPPINIHGSLLPKYRGAAPIHHAILNGDKEIGITLMRMVKEMDAGTMYFKAQQNINENTTTGEGFEIISSLAKENIVEWLKSFEKKQEGTEQGKDFSLSPKIEKSFALIENKDEVESTLRKIKGLNPFPGAYAILEGKRIKIFNASLEEVKNSIKLSLSNGTLFINEYQWENKKKVKL
ncbi:MAG: methionyl-tRNA formyltransferase [Mycoplasmataceae bacterium]|nr:methionyl-tRNA formyltransferase [Mycoplasmataceae bacterium]